MGLARPDDAWARSRLTPEEYALFLRLDPRDREHAVLVAKELLRCYPEAPGEAVRAALLHDVGKVVRPYNPVERILAALFEPWLPALPEKPLLPGWRGAAQVRLYHERYGLKLIQDPAVRAHLEEGPWAERIAEVDREF